MSPACLSKAFSWGDLSTLAPSRGACKGWGLAARNCFSLPVPCPEGPSGLEKKWAGCHGKGKSLQCRWQCFMEQIKEPDLLFMVCINIVRAESEKLFLAECSFHGSKEPWPRSQSAGGDGAAAMLLS